MRRKNAFAESAMVTSAAPIMMESLTTNRPGRSSSGKPCCGLPSAGTQHSGVVIRNDRVTNDIRKARKLPTAATCGSHGCRAIMTPKATITTPSPWANV
ncbi:MAG: hypothetical protein QOJ33_2277 [Chloroflexota bacterium]|nr:hypothetical protein [Chloroflexota bacterium]